MKKRKSRAQLNKLLHKFVDMNYAQPEDIPTIDLYMDQVLSFLNQNVAAALPDDEKGITKTMINNYSKGKILPPTDKKKYSRNHLIELIFIYYMKNFLSMDDIKQALGPVSEMAFDGDNPLNFIDIYKAVKSYEMKAGRDTLKDIIKRFDDSREFFEDVDNEADRKELQDFMLVCMLSFDVFVKKLLIEEIIKPED